MGMTVIAKTAATPKWPPVTQEEIAAPEVPATVVGADHSAIPKWPPVTQEDVAAPEVPATVVQADHLEEPKSAFDVDSQTVPPSVARRLFDLGFKSKDQRESSCAP